MTLHELHRCYDCFDEFQADLPSLIQLGSLLDECITITQALGILEPLTGEHVPPETMMMQGQNWRESLIGNGLLSRNRAVLWLLERLYGSLETLRHKDVYLAEALSGFALWLRRQLGPNRLLCSEYLEDAQSAFSDISHQDLSKLTLASSSLDLVLCNDLFEHLPLLDRAFVEIARVLRPRGRLVATCPMAFGRQISIVKAVADPATGETQMFGDAELHGDPVRPEWGSLVYRIPGWEILDQLKEAGMAQAKIHHISSWKYGVLGADLPGILVIEAQK
ncbi:methyltransferase domain-containing protein [Synechococcus sp. RSCCF101]|uniref:methyltransferase domain-containing protein n=1 Tax=Synechococcus sp. RSCCF101 TaxID=2511069 RepID=UPI001243C8F3|nr:methyltransferase domain-containing protein [Synechococcus sp. RSCCF101]